MEHKPHMITYYNVAQHNLTNIAQHNVYNINLLSLCRRALGRLITAAIVSIVCQMRSINNIRVVRKPSLPTMYDFFLKKNLV